MNNQIDTKALADELVVVLDSMARVATELATLVGALRRLAVLPPAFHVPDGMLRCADCGRVKRLEEFDALDAADGAVWCECGLEISAVSGKQMVFGSKVEMDRHEHYTHADDVVPDATPCPHGVEPSECDACFRQADESADAAREQRTFGR